jgi:hypothetical protein
VDVANGLALQKGLRGEELQIEAGIEGLGWSMAWADSRRAWKLEVYRRDVLLGP